MQRFEGKIALVTASNRGIGRACANRLASEGAKVWLACRRLKAARKAADEIIAAGGKADIVYFDGYKPETHERMVKEVIEKEGGIDVLVNNFGVGRNDLDFDLLNTDVEASCSIINTNYRVTYSACKAAIPSMIERGGGSIVNISSIGSVSPDLMRFSYNTSKTTINMLTQCIATQYGKDHIRCNAVLPGSIATLALTKNMSKTFIDTFMNACILKRLGEPEDIAAAVAYLASDDASYVTGELLKVGGGFGTPTGVYPLYPYMNGKFS